MKNDKIKTWFGFFVDKSKLEKLKDYEQEIEEIVKDSERAFYEEDEEWMDQLEKDMADWHERLNLDFGDEIEKAGGYEAPSLFWEK